MAAPVRRPDGGEAGSHAGCHGGERVMTAETFERAPRRRLGPRIDGWTIGALAVAGLVALPVLAVLLLAFRPSGDVWAHLIDTVLWRYVANTLMLLVGIGAGVFTIGVGTAWLVTMCRFPGSRLLEWALLLPLAFPTYVIAIVYVEQLEYAGPVQQMLRGLAGWQTPRDYWFPEIRSIGGAVSVLSLVLYPYVFLLARAAFLDQSVCALEVSRSLGRGPWKSFATTALPMARPAVVVGVVLALMEVLNDIGAVQQFAIHTFTTGIYEVWLGMHNAPAAAQLASLLLIFVLVLVGLERVSRHNRRYHQPSRRYRALPGYRLTGWRRTAALFACGLPVLLGFVWPALVLADWAWSTASSVHDDRFLEDVLNTLSLAAVAAALAVAVAVYLGYALRLSRGPVLSTAVRLASTGYAVPGSVIAVGVLLPFAWADHAVNAAAESLFGVSTGLILSGTVVAVSFAYLVRFLALSFGSVEASLGRITADMDGAARTLGQGPLGTLRLVHLPLIRGGVLTGALLVFVDVMKELPATLVLRPFNFSTLATRIYEYASDERFEECGLWALTIVVTGILPVILLSLGIRRSRPGSHAV